MLPRPDADLLNARDSERNVTASTKRVVQQITDWDQYRALSPEALRLFVNFHSLSAAIRSDVFKQIPFRKADFAEDLMWGKDALEAGYRIQFEPSSVALHSHNYSVIDVFRRNFDDGAACQRIVGRRLQECDVAPGIMHEIRSDWRYLESEADFSGDELEQWRIVSAMRRTAQIIGHWIGVNLAPSAGSLPSLLSITEQIKAGARTEVEEWPDANKDAAKGVAG
jgi:rhamnosyltransferase